MNALPKKLEMQNLKNNEASPSVNTFTYKFLRIIMLIFTQIFGLYGFIGGIIFTLAVVGLNKTIAGTSYVYPLMPLDFKVFLQRFYRVSLKAKNKK